MQESKGRIIQWVNEIRIFRKLRFLFVYPLVIGAVWTAHTTENQLKAGILIVAFGEALRLWANGYVGHRKVAVSAAGSAKIGRLITGGPYAFVRNPLYLGSGLIGAGFCVAMGSLWLGGLALALFLLIYDQKIREEEARIRSEWGSDYDRYCGAVPRWIPTGRRYTDRFGEWTWQGILASKEWKTLIWAAVGILALYLREEIIQEHEFMSPEGWGRQAAAIALILALVLSDLICEKKKVSAPG